VDNVRSAQRSIHAIPEADKPAYSVLPGGANCESSASGVLEAVGVPPSEIKNAYEQRLFGSQDLWLETPYDYRGLIQDGTNALNRDSIERR